MVNHSSDAISALLLNLDTKNLISHTYLKAGVPFLKGYLQGL